jgi:hypothetical protein
MAKLEFEINSNTELGIIKTEQDLDNAITVQLKAHGYTNVEIKEWFKEIENENLDFDIED